MSKDIGLRPAGWRILIKPVSVSNKSKGGVIIPDEIQDIAKLSSVIGQVISVGAEAYRDPNKFTAAWVGDGDWVVIAKFSGAKFKINGEEYRLVNDDEILAIVEDPKTITPY
jgi:chaperonin GroES|tara:strand:- start:5154 stop:5489 length:336 start_codon:yes stop_codon:yes gene_type:complete